MFVDAERPPLECLSAIPQVDISMVDISRSTVDSCCVCAAQMPHVAGRGAGLKLCMPEQQVTKDVNTLCMHMESGTSLVQTRGAKQDDVTVA